MFNGLNIDKNGGKPTLTTTPGMFGGDPRGKAPPATTGYVPTIKRSKDKPKAAKPEPTAKGTLAIPVGMKAKPDKTFFNNYVNGPYTQTPGIGAIDRAYADGRTYQQIMSASAIQNFNFQPDALRYLQEKVSGEQRDDKQAIEDNYQQRFADLEALMGEQQKSYSDRLAEMSNTLQESQNKTQAALLAAHYQGTREPVLGVRGTASKDGSDIQKLTRQGMGGSFNRSGLRIKGLNVG